MSTTIVSNLAVFSDASGHGNQSHLVYAPVQARWWLFVIKTQTADVVSTYVSSSNDLTTATWSASTDSGTLTQACTTNDQRNLGVALVPNGINSNDAVHVDVTTSAGGAINDASKTSHVRAKFTGASGITWETWSEVTTTIAGAGSKIYKGNTVGVSSSGKIHKCQNDITNAAPNNTGDPLTSIGTNADSVSAWTNGFGSIVTPDDTLSFACGAYAFGTLASDAMVLVYQNANVSDTTGGGLDYVKYTSGATWPGTPAGADVGIGTSTQDQNDWCLCRVDATHVYAIRRDSASTYLCRMFNGTTWSTPASTLPSQNHKAGSGLFAATDGTSLWLFVLDSASNQPVQYCKGSTANGTISFAGSWTQLESAGSAARNYISGSPAVGNSQIGVIYTVVNGSNFDIALSVLSTAGVAAAGPTTLPNLGLSHLTQPVLSGGVAAFL